MHLIILVLLFPTSSFRAVQVVVQNKAIVKVVVQNKAIVNFSDQCNLVCVCVCVYFFCKKNLVAVKSAKKSKLH